MARKAVSLPHWRISLWVSNIVGWFREKFAGIATRISVTARVMVICLPKEWWGLAFKDSRMRG
jgi:hypothetical protein